MSMQELVNVLDEMCECILTGNTLNKFAKIYKKLYDELQKEGFSPEEALEIVSNYNPGGKN